MRTHKGFEDSVIKRIQQSALASDPAKRVSVCWPFMSAATEEKVQKLLLYVKADTEPNNTKYYTFLSLANNTNAEG